MPDPSTGDGGSMTDSCPSTNASTPYCYSGTCGCGISSSGAVVSGDGLSQGTCESTQESCYSDGICRGNLLTYKLQFLSVFIDQ